MPPKAPAREDPAFLLAASLAARLGESADWQGRISALRELAALFANGLDDGALSALRDAKAAQRLGEQLADLRSEVTREATAAVIALTDAACDLPGFAPLVVEVLCTPLLKLCAVPHKVMSDQGHAAAGHTFGAAASHRLLARLAEAQLDRRAPHVLRARCAEYLRSALASWPEDVLARDPDTLEAALLAGVSDASPDVRTAAAREAACAFAPAPRAFGPNCTAVDPRSFRPVLCAPPTGPPRHKGVIRPLQGAVPDAGGAAARANGRGGCVSCAQCVARPPVCSAPLRVPFPSHSTAFALATSSSSKLFHLTRCSSHSHAPLFLSSVQARS